jgi:Dolichyl-phosphate-mannose-protein mannosyltransferase
MKFNRQNILPLLVLISTFLVTGLIYNFQNILFYRPQAVHQSRQSDCASYTLNYYQNNNPFLKPQLHSLIAKDGYSASEFPVIYYFTAQLYRIFGPHEFLLRLVNLLIFYLGLFALYNLSRHIIGNDWLALIPPFFMMTSPFVMYYANNFLPNVPALSLVFAGWLFFFKYKDRPGNGLFLLYISAACFLLASLLKISAGIGFIAIVSLFILQLSGIYKFKPIIRPNEKTHWIVIIFLVIGLTTAWYLNAAWFNQINHTGQHLLGILPIWDISKDKIFGNLNYIWVTWRNQYHHVYTQVFIFLMVVFLIIRFKRIKTTLNILLFLLLSGVVIYTLLWFQVFMVHDYYLVNLMILPVFVLIVFLKQMKEIRIRKPWAKSLMILLLLLFFGFNVNHCRVMIDDRYEGSLFSTVHSGLFTITPYLREIGIKRTDRVMVVPDESPNTSLYLINNPGWTEAFTSREGGVNIYDFWINGDMHYWIVCDSSYLNDEYYRRFTAFPIGHYQGINIYEMWDHHEGQFKEGK